MAGLVAFLERHRIPLAVVASLLILYPVASSALGGGEEVHVVADAPRKGEAMSVHVKKETNLLDTCPGEATVEVLRQDFIVYSSALGRIPMDDCTGTIEIPYERFAVANGPYEVVVNYDGQTAETIVEVHKVVNWVYVRAFDQADEERTRIDVALDAARGQPLSSSVFASGTLVMDIYWDECSDDGPLDDLDLNPSRECRAQHTHVFHAEIPVDSRASTHVFVPWDNLDSAQTSEDDDQPREGWYNVTATFHNDVAKGNDAVPMDPTVFNEDPPGNWFEVDYE